MEKRLSNKKIGHGDKAAAVLEHLTEESVTSAFEFLVPQHSFLNPRDEGGGTCLLSTEGSSRNNL